MKKLNVQKGDRAIVVRMPKGNPHGLGLPVLVLREQRQSRMMKAAWGHSWWLTSLSGRKTLVNGVMREVFSCPDWALRKLNDYGKQEAPSAPAPAVLEPA